MVRKLSDYKTNAIREAIEEILGIPSKEVAITVREDERIEADCQLLKKIPEHSFEELKNGYWYSEGTDDENLFEKSDEANLDEEDHSTFDVNE